MLNERFPLDSLPQLLLPRETYHPFPTAEERAVWDRLPDALRAEILREGEDYLGYDWPMIPATRLLDFTRNGDRSRHAAVYYPRRTALKALVKAECVEGQGRFLDDIINGIWALCEESSWCIPAHAWVDGKNQPLPDVDRPIIDLFAAETGAVLTWTHYLLRNRLDAITPLISARLRREVKLRITDPYLDNHYHWMGAEWWRVNNWNPWCNSNCLVALLLMEENSERRLVAVDKALSSLDRFFAAYLPDGGCDEGPGYWSEAGGALFDALELLHGASEGRINVYEEPLVREIGRYIMRVHISDRYFVNFADGGAKVGISADLVYRYGQRIGDPELMNMGASAAPAVSVSHPFNFLRDLSAIFNWEELRASPAKPPYLRDVWMDGIQVMTAREQQGSDRGFYLAAKGGNNGESHNHNDVGSFIVYLDGRPLIIDIGVETYSGKTFGPDRYTIWTMQSAYHNLPTVNSIMQKEGGTFAAKDVAYQADDTRAELSIDIAAAYPPEAGVATWRRTCRLNRDESMIEISENFRLDAPTAEITLTFMTPCEPSLEAAGTLTLNEPTGLRAYLHFDAAQLAATFERLPVEDKQLQAVWGDHLYRILLSPVAPVAQEEWTVRITRE